ncbi:phage antirepressor N-terminal domain-containing protein [Acinetobacter baumannii]|uniref:phage antirepressor N-terminal domain-containing protein n=1 Tax=Acinetobacter baumannii TaxID=470 RepID=UPI003D69E589
MRTLTQINVPFHSADLVIIEFNNQPFTAMRPIVEGMGLTWQSQYEKLKLSEFPRQKLTKETRPTFFNLLSNLTEEQYVNF